MRRADSRHRRFGWLVKGSAACTGVLVLLLCALMLPPVQARLLRLVSASLDGVTVEADAIGFGPRGGALKGLSIEGPGFSLQADAVDLALNPWASLRGLKLAVDALQFSAVRVHLQPAPAAAADAAPGPATTFRGLAPILRWPQRVSVKAAAAQGSLLWESADQRTLSGPWELALSDLAADSSARLRLSAELRAARGEQAVAAANALLDAAATVAGDGLIKDAEADLKLRPGDGRGPSRPLVVAAQLQLAAEVESGHLSIVNALEQQVAKLRADYRPASGDADLQWSIDLGSRLIRTFAAAGVDSELDLKSSGQARLDFRQASAHLEASLNASGRGWEWLDPRLAQLGRFAIDADLETRGWAQVWTARQLHGRLTTAARQEVLRLELGQPTTIDLARWRLVPERWGEAALSLTARELPLGWLRGFDPAGVFESGAVSGVIDVIPLAEAHVRIAASEPIHVSDLRLRRQGDRPLPLLTITLQPKAEIHDGALQALVEPLTVVSETGLRLDFWGQAATSTAAWPTLDFNGMVALRAPFIQRRAREVEAVRGLAQASLDLGGLMLSLDALGLDAIDHDKQSLASLVIKGDSPLKVSLASRAIDWDDFQPQHVQLEFKGLPIAWLSPYLPEIDLAAGAVYGEFAAEARRDSGFALKAVRPFEIRGIVPLYRGTRFARNLKLSLEPSVHLNNTGGAVVLDDILLVSRGGDRLGGSLRLGWASNPPTQLAMKLEIEGFFPSLTPRIGKLGEMRWTQRGSIDLASREMGIDQLAITLNDISGTRFVAVNTLQPFRIANDPLGFATDGDATRVLKVTLTPLELQSLLPRLLGLDVEGVLPRGEFYGRVDREGRLLLTAATPLVFQDVTLRWEGTTLVEELDLGLSYEVAYSVDGLEARSLRMDATDSRKQPLAGVTLKAVAPLTPQRPLRSLDLDLNVALRALSRQPVLDGTQPLEAGTLSARLTVLREARRQLRGRVQVNGARAARLGPLPDLAASLEVDAAPGEGMTVALPLAMTSRRGNSDLAFKGTASRLGERYRFDAGLEGERLIVPDLRQWRAWLLDAQEHAPAPAAGRRAPSRTTLMQLRQRRDDTPFWSDRLLGHAALKVAHLQLAHNTVQDVRGQFQVMPGRVALYGVRAALGKGRLRSSGSIDFHGDRPLPYDMTYRLHIDELQIADLLRPLQPDEPPVAEGLFALTTNLKGQGRNGLDLALGSLGDIALSGRQGVFRGLAGRGKTASKAAKVVGALTFSRQLRAIGRLLDDLDELPFSRMSVSLLRDSPRQLRLEDISLIAPRLRLAGRGSVTAQPGLALALSPMEASLDLAARGDMAILFDGMGLLEEGADGQGFRAMNRSLTIGGSLAEPDTSALWDALDEAAASASGSFGLGLRAINRKLKAGR